MMYMRPLQKPTLPAEKRWTVEIIIDEQDGRTYAEARLHTLDDTRLRGVGRAKLHPADEDIPEIGDEIAAARALTDLGHRLLLAAAADLRPATLSVGQEAGAAR